MWHKNATPRLPPTVGISFKEWAKAKICYETLHPGLSPCILPTQNLRNTFLSKTKEESSHVQQTEITPWWGFELMLGFSWHLPAEGWLPLGSAHCLYLWGQQSGAQGGETRSKKDWMDSISYICFLDWDAYFVLVEVLPEGLCSGELLGRVWWLRTCISSSLSQFVLF